MDVETAPPGAGSRSKRFRLPTRVSGWLQLCTESLNFYRVHVIYFTLTPLVVAAIMWGTSSDGFSIPYIDCLFCCMSAMTVTGLATINLSTLSAFQQALLLILMLIGNPPVVSLVTIIVRRHFFRSAFRHAIQERQKRRSSFGLSRTITRATTGPLTAIRKRFSTNLREPEKPPEDVSTPDINGRDPSDRGSDPKSVEMKAIRASDSPPPKKSKFHMGKKKMHNISKGMIKRVEGGGVGLVNPMGWYDAERAETPSPSPAKPSDSTKVNNTDDDVFVDDSDEEVETPPAKAVATTTAPPPTPIVASSSEDAAGDGRRRPTPPTITIPTILTGEHGLNQVTESPTHNTETKQPYAGRLLADEAFPRSKTIAFDDTDDGFDHDHRAFATGREGGYMPRTATYRSQNEGRLPISATTSMPRTYSLRPSVTRKPDTRLSGFGGFPTPFEIVRTAVQHVFPKTTQGLTKTLSMPRTSTIGGRGTIDAGDTKTKEVPYISFAATVGRNSRFTGLTEEQMNELGGVEYRALKVLLVIVIGYILFFMLAAFVIIAPYISAKGRYDDVFEAQPRLVSIPWFSFWQSVSAFTNTGMSLVDKSMVPFQSAYAMIIAIIVLILAGNTAFPIFLRIIVWCTYKLTPRQSRVKETLKFLLDHPRRCFIYLFPTTQTWFLTFVVLGLTLTDWVSFLVLDIGTPAIEAIPVGTRIADAFLQSAAVRAAGFGIVPLSELAPAVQVLYVIMMYISVYPIALSVRATNVYEERSLGLYHDEGEDEEMNEAEQGKGAQAVAKYLGWHARRQLAFDIWWLGFALWLICIIERGAIDATSSDGYLNVFTILFELVSGYGTVGLSLGLPYDSYSLCGGFRKLSKLVLVVVMLRGRHRGLPVAIDRAVMLPRDFTAAEEEVFEDRIRRMSRRGSMDVSDEFIQSLRRGSMSNMSTAMSPDVNHPVPGTSAPATPGRPRGRSISPSARTHRRTGSSSAAQSGPPSPVVMHFFPSGRGSIERQRASTIPTPLRSGGGPGAGLLSLAEESTMSRRNSVNEGEVERGRKSL